MSEKLNKIVSILLIVLITVVSIVNSNITASATEQGNVPSVSYTAHVQNTGWQSFVKDGGFAGTEGKSYRVEGIIVKLDTGSYTGGIKYRSYIQGIGWQDYMNSGSMTGTNGQSKRLEAIQIQLTGDIANYYDVYYTVHAQNYGWLGWAKNGETSGTVGYGYRLEGIMIKLVKKGDTAPSNGKTQKSYEQSDRPFINYMTYVQNEGWKESVRNGGFSGSSGKAQRIESIIMNVDSTSVSGGIRYRAMIQGNSNWTAYAADGATCGTSGQSKRLEAIQIELTGDLVNKYDVYYRTYVENRGWMGWAKNGETSGSTGYNARIEAIQIQPVAKGSAAPGSTSNAAAVLGEQTKIEVTGVTLNKSSLALTEGGSETLQATIQPSNATTKTVTWSSSNTSVATIDSNGKVTAVKAGTATITAASNNGKKASCTVTVSAKTVAVTGVSISNKQDTLALDFNGSNNSYQCKASVSPSNATNKSVTWSSSNTSVATIDSNGNIKAIARGVATITVKTADGGKTDTMKVYVYKSGAAVPSYGSNQWLCFQTRRDGSYVLDVANGKTDNGTSVLSYKFKGDENQLWRFRQKSGGYDIYPKCSSDGKAVLDVKRGSSYSDPIKAGLKIDLWKTGEDDPACTWNLVRLWDADDGTAIYIIKLANYDYAIAVDSLGGQLVLKKFDVMDVNQKWTVAVKTVSTDAVTQKIASLRSKYVHGQYWNKYNGLDGTGTIVCPCGNSTCINDCPCKCGAFVYQGQEIAWQCHGFALKMAYEVFGENANTWSKHTNVNSIYAGDVVRINNDSHTIFITKVDGNNIYYVDCNYVGKCKVRWDGCYTRSQLSGIVTHIAHKNGNTSLGK